MHETTQRLQNAETNVHTLVSVTSAVNITQWLMWSPDSRIQRLLCKERQLSISTLASDGIAADAAIEAGMRQLLALKHASIHSQCLPQFDPLFESIIQITPYMSDFEWHVQDGCLYASVRHHPTSYRYDRGVLQELFGDEHMRICHLHPELTWYDGRWLRSEQAIPLMHNAIYRKTLDKIDEMQARITAGETSLKPYVPLAARLITGTGINTDAWATDMTLSSTTLHFPQDMIREGIRYIEEEVPHALDMASVDDLPLSAIFQCYEEEPRNAYADGVIWVLRQSYPELQDLVTFVDSEDCGYILARPQHYETDVALLQSMFPNYVIDKFAVVYDADDIYHE